MALGGSLAGVARVILRVDDEQYNRDLAQARGNFQKTASGLEHDAGKMERGVLAGSGAFHSLGRSVAYASGFFLGAAGFTAAVRGSVGAAEDLEKAHRALNTQIRAVGGSVGYSAGVIEQTDEKMRLLGRTSTETELAFTRLVRASGSVTEAQKLIGLTANIAAARHISMEQASVAVARVLSGSTSVLNRYGLSIAKGTSVTDALRIAQQRFAGQAAATTTPLDRLHASVTDLEAAAGTALLPTINSVATSLNKWISSSKNQQRVTHDVTTVIHDASVVFSALRDVVKSVDDATGGFKNTLEALLAFKVAAVISGWSGAFSAFIGSEAAGAGVAGAAGKTGLLNKRLGLLRTLTSKPFQFVIAYEIIKKITGSNADLSDNLTGTADLLPVFRNGKWVNQQTGEVLPPGDQAYWNKQYRQDGGKGKPAAGATAAGDVGGSVQGGLVSTARGTIGNAYSYGGAPSLSKPTDCSGLMVAVFSKNGISLPRTSQAQYASAPIKNAKPLLPGDLVFTEGVHPGHVGLYIGNNQVLEDPHTGDHVKVVSLSAFGWNGESARWWGGKANTGSGGSDTSPAWHPPAAKTTGTKASVTDLPGATSESIASASRAFDAHPTIKNMQAFVAAQNTAIDDLTKKLNNTTNHKIRAQLIDAIAQHETAIRDAYAKMKKPAPKATDITALPGRYDDAVTLAENTLGTKGLNMVIDAEAKAIDVLNARLKKAHGENRVKLEIAIRERQNTIKDARAQMATIAAGKATTALGKFTSGLDKETSTVTGIVKGITDTISGLTAGDQVVDITDSKGKVTGREFKGATQVVYDPKSGQYVVQSVKPSVDAMKKELADLVGTTLPGLRGRIKRTQNAIAQLKAHNRKGKNNKKIAALAAHEADLRSALGDAEDQATGLSNTITELEAELQLPTNKDESFTPEGLFPSSLLLGGAQADLAGDRGAQLGILGQEEGILRGALASGGYSTEDQISITQALTGIVGQESSINSGIASDAKSAADDAAAARSTYLDSLIAIPTGLRLSAAYAGLGGSTTAAGISGQESAVQAELAFVNTQQKLLEGMTQTDDVQERLISLLGTRNSLESDLASLMDTNNQLQDQKNTAQAEENAQLISYLQARSDLFRSYGDTVIGRALAGSNVTVNNHVYTSEDNAHLLTQQIGFELQTLT